MVRQKKIDNLQNIFTVDIDFFIKVLYNIVK